MTDKEEEERKPWIKRFKFTYLLPVLILIMILYEFATLGFSTYASVNKILGGVIYGIGLYILAYIIKGVATAIWDRVTHKETNLPEYVQH